MPMTWMLTAALAAMPAGAPADTAAAEPPMTCVAATLRADGKFAKRRVEVGSGDKAADRRALAYLGMLDLSRSVPDFEPVRQSGYIVVRQTRPNAFSLAFSDGRGLHASCEAAYAAIAAAVEAD
ncbi:MAG TPA: hypothetical protein VMR06_11170 [Dokdonella sp.]|uniref:hypothetical protein n=1 Tax=Dokdonella sp. TaxID=2291710 RepID=UPI002C5A231D|nr:hypothetical protein [Dokdonella sp.]HUD42539.1 hypothetical protein [Dokdonella sp.]